MPVLGVGEQSSNNSRKEEGVEGVQDRGSAGGSKGGTGVLSSELPHCPPVDASDTDPSRMPVPWACPGGSALLDLRMLEQSSLWPRQAGLCDSCI